MLVIVFHAWLVGLATPKLSGTPKRLLSFGLAWLWCSVIQGIVNRGDSTLAQSTADAFVSNFINAVLGFLGFTLVIAARDRLRKKPAVTPTNPDAP